MAQSRNHPRKNPQKKDRHDKEIEIRKIEGKLQLYKWGMVVFCLCFLGYMANQSIKEISGKTTAFSSVMDLATNLRVNEFFWLALSVLLGGTTVYYRQSGKKGEKAAGRAKDLEIQIDPNRSSSLKGQTDEGQS